MKSKLRSYKAWYEMIRRRYNPKRKFYEYYGGRGIIVCERWKVYENFFEDMGEPKEGLTLDRIDNNGNYEPNNCKWSTRKEQIHNRRMENIVKLTASEVQQIRDSYIGGETQVSLSKRYNVTQPAISYIVNNKRWAD